MLKSSSCDTSAQQYGNKAEKEKQICDKCTCVGALHGGVRCLCGGEISLYVRDIEDLLTAMRFIRQQDRH